MGKIVLYTVTICAFVALFVAITLTGNVTVFAYGEYVVTLQPILVGFTIIWLASSIKIIPFIEQGAIFFYGIEITRVGQGPKVILSGIFQLEKLTAEIQENHYPDDVEYIQHTPDSEPLQSITVQYPDGTFQERLKVRPIRFISGGSSGTGVLDTQMNGTITFWVRWSIDDVFKFLLATGGDLNQAVAQMRNTGVSEFMEEASKLSPAEIISGLQNLKDSLKNAVLKSVGTWGVKIQEVGLGMPDFGHGVADAMSGVTRSKANAASTVIGAEAERQRIEAVGKGEGVAIQHKLSGEGKGLRDAAKHAKLTPEEILAARVAEKTVGEGSLIIGTDGIAQAIGIGKTILESTKKE